MIIVINGPLGIGKTETSWQLMQRFMRAVMLDGDCLTAIHPFDHDNPSHLDYAYEVFGLLISFHRQKGIHDFVLHWVFESPASLQRLQAKLAPAGERLRIYRLVCTLQALEGRIHQRNHPELSWELQRARELHGILEGAAQTGDVGYVVDTTHRSIAETAEAIWKHAHGQS
jgi:broad-specificity NMP kinase